MRDDKKDRDWERDSRGKGTFIPRNSIWTQISRLRERARANRRIDPQIINMKQ